MGEYSGSTVAITGAGSGLGAAMAELFAGAGANLVLLDIDAANAEARAAELRGRGADVLAMRCDVASRDSLAGAARAVGERFGSVEVLCANVGVQQFGAIDVLSEADWDWVLGVNVKGAVNTVAAFLPLLRQQPGARRHVVLTSSASFFQDGIRMAAYVASKYAVTGYGEVLHDELAEEGIGVSILFPAGMTTRHLESSMAARPRELGESRLDMADIRAMTEKAGISGGVDVASAAHAVRNLLADLRAGERYIVTHGGYRDQVEAKQAAILRAFARMERG